MHDTISSITNHTTAMNSNMKKAPPTASKTHLSSKLNNMKVSIT